MSRPLDDLLRPSLGEEHDVPTVESPYSPMAILYCTFFLGPGFGLILAWWNEPRCGLRRRPLLVGAYVLTLIAMGIGVAAYVGDDPGGSAATTSASDAEINAEIEALVARVLSEKEQTEEEKRQLIAAREALEEKVREGRQQDAAVTSDAPETPAEAAFEKRKTRYRLVQRALGVALLAFFLAPQRRRVSIARSRGIETVPFWGVGIVAFLVTSVTEIATAVTIMVSWEVFS